MRFVMGIDEAGRAPLAGPVSVGAVIVADGFDILTEFPGVRDSKKLTADRREALFSMLEKRAKRGDVRFVVRFSDHAVIDELGITRAVRKATYACIRALVPKREEGDVKIFLDGSLFAPSQYEQETVIHGDDLIPLISLASIAAKVKRDRLMRRIARKYPEYGFERHVGYPTKAHYEALRKFGLCDIHRRRYCESFVGQL